VEDPGQIVEDGDAEIVTFGDRTVRIPAPLVIEPHGFEMMHRYLLPFSAIDAVTCNTEVKTPL